MKVCLFGDDEYSIRDAMRAGQTDLEIQTHIAGAVAKKNYSLGVYSTVLVHMTD
jgi:molybdenum cofactor biosynthesis enzyme MoaA